MNTPNLGYFFWGIERWWKGALLVPLLILVGCIESDDHYIINPDGSGKLQHSAKVVAVDINIGGREKSVEEKAKGVVSKLIQESEGIDAWKDVTYSVLPDGRVQINGTAYFHDLAQVVLKHGGNNFDLLKPSYQVEGGKAVLSLEWDEDESSNSSETGGKVADVERLTTERSKYLQMKPMMAAMFGNMKMRQKFSLPAAVESVSNLQQEGKSVILQLTGTDMMQGIDDFIQDDAWLLAQLNSGKEMGQGFTPDSSLNEKLFGTADDVSAVTAEIGKAQFDYVSEMEAARQAMPAMLEQLELNKAGNLVPIKSPASGDGFQGLIVGGIRMVRDVGDDTARPFNWSPGLSVALTGTFAGSVLEVKKGVVTHAETMDGESLLPDSEFEREVRFPNLSDDGTKATFEVNLDPPSNVSNGIRGIAGKIEYWTSTATREVDLEFTSLATGSSGAELGAVIGEYSENSWGGKTGYQVVLDLEVSVAQVKEVRFLDQAGNSVEGIKKSGHSGFDQSVSLNFSSEKPYPEQGNIIVILHDKIQRYEIPFETGPFDWLGMPISTP